MNADQAIKCTYISITMSTICVAHGQISHAQYEEHIRKNIQNQKRDYADLS